MAIWLSDWPSILLQDVSQYSISNKIRGIDNLISYCILSVHLPISFYGKNQGQFTHKRLAHNVVETVSTRDSYVTGRLSHHCQGIIDQQLSTDVDYHHLAVLFGASKTALRTAISAT